MGRRVAPAQLSDARRSLAFLEVLEHPVDDVGRTVRADAGDEAARRDRVDLRPDHDRLELQRRRPSVERQAEHRLVSHLQRVAVSVKRAPFAEMSQIDTAASPKRAESGGGSK